MRLFLRGGTSDQRMDSLVLYPHILQGKDSKERLRGPPATDIGSFSPALPVLLALGGPRQVSPVVMSIDFISGT